MQWFRVQAIEAINSWEVYKKLQSEKDLFNAIFAGKQAIHIFNIIQFSLIQTTWIALAKLWDNKTREKNNVRFSIIYALIKPGSFYEAICLRYKEEYGSSVEDKFKEEISLFLEIYNKYTNGNKNNIYLDIKNIRNNFLSHALLGGALQYSHTMDELEEFYNDSLKMLETAYSIFGVAISLSEFRDIRSRHADNFVNIIRSLSES
ncbi:hypothetical protein Amal_03725 [Acetobacter malorum]|uniref:HEPN AbiU2-like domain-containing protein n=1 Tax=Acetobacter malorum TaxID=178901 RepID=A0A177G420_9PROT|nr:hypothetical protein Amal_03725 [Acetobacter malorum]